MTIQDPDQNGLVLRVTTSDGKVEIEYGDGWEAYLHHEKYPQFQVLLKDVEGKIAKVAGKGKSQAGKGE